MVYVSTTFCATGERQKEGRPGDIEGRPTNEGAALRTVARSRCRNAKLKLMSCDARRQSRKSCSLVTTLVVASDTQHFLLALHCVYRLPKIAVDCRAYLNLYLAVIQSPPRYNPRDAADAFSPGCGHS
jgi:hypothetical protein